MRRAVLALCLATQASAAHAETRYMVGVDTSWDLQAATPRLQLVSVDVATDKLQHLVAGAAIAWVLSLAGYAPPTALAGTVTVGALKEVRDLGLVPGIGTGHPEFSDFAWTMLGGVAYLGVQSMLTRPQPVPGPAAVR